MEQRDAPRSRRRTRNEPRLGARKRRRRRRTVDRARPDPSRGGLGGDGAGRGPRRAGRRPPLRHAVRRTGMTVLVTGGSGLVGSHVIEALRAGSKPLDEPVVREAAEGGLTAVAPRANVSYGERDRLFTPRVIRVVRSRVVPRIGPGTNHLACVYAGNIAAAVVTALGAPVSGFRAYNVTRDAPPVPTQHEFLASFAAALGVRPVTIPIPERLARGVMTVLTSRRLARAAAAFITGENPYVDERARRELAWRPPFTAASGVQRSVRWFLENEEPGR